MQMPLEQHKPCPYCGFASALLIMDFFGTLPQLDTLGYPQYHCAECGTTFTVLDEPLVPPTPTTQENTSTPEKEGDEHGHQ